MLYLLVGSNLQARRLNLSKGKWGGNRKAQTFRDCEHCGQEFGPLPNLSRRFCGKSCAYEFRKTMPRKIIRKVTKKARSAQSLLAYHVNKGNIIRPKTCESCGGERKIEGAHYNYDEPLRVRWLCRSCHVKWDKEDPKGGTVIIQRWEDFTGSKASIVTVQKTGV